MYETKKINIVLLAVFIFIETALYVIIMENLLSPIRHFCYLSVIICFLFTLYNYKNSSNSKLMFYAVCFTLVADLCLVLLEVKDMSFAMTVFTFTHITYGVREMKNSQKKVNRISLAVRIILSVILIILGKVVMKNGFNYLIFITMIYFANILSNVAFSFFENKKDLLFIIGLILFLFCDIYTGFGFLDLTLAENSFLQKLLYPHFNAIWLFYLPAQTVLAISTFKKSE